MNGGAFRFLCRLCADRFRNTTVLLIMYYVIKGPREELVPALEAPLTPKLQQRRFCIVFGLSALSPLCEPGKRGVVWFELLPKIVSCVLFTAAHAGCRRRVGIHLPRNTPMNTYKFIYVPHKSPAVGLVGLVGRLQLFSAVQLGPVKFRVSHQEYRV